MTGSNPDQPMDLDRILEEMQRKNETLKRLHQLKAENEALELALVLDNGQTRIRE